MNPDGTFVSSLQTSKLLRAFSPKNIFLFAYLGWRGSPSRSLPSACPPTDQNCQFRRNRDDGNSGGKPGSTGSAEHSGPQLRWDHHISQFVKHQTGYAAGMVTNTISVHILTFFASECPWKSYRHLETRKSSSQMKGQFALHANQRFFYVLRSKCPQKKIAFCDHTIYCLTAGYSPTWTESPNSDLFCHWRAEPHQNDHDA